VPASISGTIAVGTTPTAIAVDPTENKIYVTDFGTTPLPTGILGSCSASGADITVIDGATESPTAVRIQSFYEANPFGIAFNPAKQTVHAILQEFASINLSRASVLADGTSPPF
jgi:DNA-binding beta-propeller fold protein YncE